MDIFDALNLAPKDVIALVGGGGKTSIMFTLGREALRRGMKTILTTTTRIFKPEDSVWPLIVTKNDAEMAARLQSELTARCLAIVGSEITFDQKMLGIKPHLVSEIMRSAADLAVIEADGSARKPFKAPAGHEPVIPDGVTVVVPVVGIDCLDQPITEEYVHRPELVAELAEVKVGDILTSEIVAKVLTHPDGFRKHLPQNSRWVPFINKVETDGDLAKAEKIAFLVGKAVPCRVILGAARNTSPVKKVLDF